MSAPIAKRDTVIPSAPPAKNPKGKGDRRRDEVSEFLAFGLNGERFALPLGSVREILKLAPITEVPRARPHVLGKTGQLGQRPLHRRQRDKGAAPLAPFDDAAQLQLRQRLAHGGPADPEARLQLAFRRQHVARPESGRRDHPFDAIPHLGVQGDAAPPLDDHRQTALAQVFRTSGL